MEPVVKNEPASDDSAAARDSRAIERFQIRVLVYLVVALLGDFALVWNGHLTWRGRLQVTDDVSRYLLCWLAAVDDLAFCSLLLVMARFGDRSLTKAVVLSQFTVAFVHVAAIVDATRILPPPGEFVLLYAEMVNLAIGPILFAALMYHTLVFSLKGTRYQLLMVLVRAVAGAFFWFSCVRGGVMMS